VLMPPTVSRRLIAEQRFLPMTTPPNEITGAFRRLTPPAQFRRGWIGFITIPSHGGSPDRRASGSADLPRYLTLPSMCCPSRETALPMHSPPPCC